MSDTRNISAFAIPEGTAFLNAVMDISSQCERSTDEFLAAPSSNGPIETHEHLGTVLSLLDCATSCWWGCRGGDHVAEHMLGRCSSYGMGAFRLARSGYYDESLALTRTVGEITNLALLFLADPGILHEWSTADEKTRRDKYCPVAVRRALEKKSIPVPVNQHRYGQISAKAVHLTPSIPPQMYNAEKHPKTGGYFQKTGMLFCLHEVGYTFGIVGPCAVGLCGLENENGAKLLQAAERLSQSLPALRARINITFPGTFS